MKLSEILTALEEGKTIAKMRSGTTYKRLYKFIIVEGRRYCLTSWEDGGDEEISRSLVLYFDDQYEIRKETSSKS